MPVICTVFGMSSITYQRGNHARLHTVVNTHRTEEVFYIIVLFYMTFCKIPKNIVAENYRDKCPLLFFKRGELSISLSC